MPQAASSDLGARAARGLILLAACAVALFNGSLWSPVYDSVAYILYLATRGYPMMTAARAADATPFVIGIMTLLIAGIPAAIYERIRGLQTSSWGSMLIWLGATVLLSLPTILNAMGG
jgi:hypothetical protein